jgi:hypothetical protein
MASSTNTQFADPVLAIHGPDPACAVGRSVQQTLTALDRTVFDAVATQLDRFTIQDVLDEKIPTPSA